jgi:O-succinylbenzoic acid--CoA ligase
MRQDGAMREVLLDGSPAAATELMRALRAALDGSGPAVLPRPAADPVLGPDGPVPSGIAVVVATSGSGGDAKGVLLSAAALRASAAATHARLGGPGRWLLALPAQHIAGVQVLVRSIIGGREPVLMPTALGFRPRTFTEAAADVLADDGPRYTALVPTQLARLIADAGDALAALRAFDAVLLGGAATPDRLLAQAREAGVRVVTTYGMTETAGGCVYDGIPLDGVVMRIGAGGLIELSGPMLASGYRDRPKESAAAFAGGWFHTTDLGRLTHDGRLEVLGRVDDVINTGGVKVATAAVERVLAAQPRVAQACVVGVPDDEWGQLVAAAVVSADPAHPPDLDELRAAVRTELGAPATPKLLRLLDELPLHGPGKVDRAAVRDLLDCARP